MNNFLKNLRESVDAGSVNQGAIDKLNEINEINKLVVEKYGQEKAGEKMSRRDLSKLEQKVDDLVGERKDGIEQELFKALEALGENIVVKEEIEIEDTMNKVMSQISEEYYFSITGLLLDEFGVKEKELDDIELDDVHLNEANNILSKICLFEIEYCDFLENSIFYNEDILIIKNDLIKILKK